MAEEAIRLGANKAERLWAWVTEYPDGSVGQIGAVFGGAHHSLVTRDRSVAMRFRGLAEGHARGTGQRTWLREYVLAKDHEEV